MYCYKQVLLISLIFAISCTKPETSSAKKSDDILNNITNKQQPQYEQATNDECVDFSDLIMNDTNYKDQLLRYFQHTFQITPKYQMISQEGQPHERVFRMSVLDKNNDVLAVGEGRTKKKAEQMASKKALVYFGVIEDDANLK